MTEFSGPKLVEFAVNSVQTTTDVGIIQGSSGNVKY